MYDDYLRPRTNIPFKAPMSTNSCASSLVKHPQLRIKSTKQTAMHPSTFKIRFGFYKNKNQFFTKYREQHHFFTKIDHLNDFFKRRDSYDFKRTNLEICGHQMCLYRVYIIDTKTPV